MTSIVFLIEQTAIGLYILLAVGILWYFRKWLLARQAYRATSFELERDLARYKSGNAFTVVILLAEAILIVIGMHNVVAPTVREDQAVIGEAVEVVETIEDVFVTPTRPSPSGSVPFDPSGVEFGNEESLQIFSTPVLTATPVGTIEPNAPEVIGCDTPNAMLQIPANGMRVFQPIPVMGTAFADNFSTYKLEIRRPGSQFSVLDSKSIPIQETGTLSQFNPISYDPGTYEFQLMVFDTTDTLAASCQITIYITEPIPTPTPIG